MLDYMLAGKKVVMLNDVQTDKHDISIKTCFANEVIDGYTLANKSLSGATFANVSLKGAVFSDINFSYCVFVNCYFRGAKFRNCNFTGSKFIGCNFRGATIANCDLSYSQWKETIVEKNAVLANLPRYDNVAQELLINMRLNANSIGEYDDARIYVYKSEEKSRRYNLSKFKGATNYYKKKYSIDQRAAALLRYLKSHVERLVWGYGEKVMNLSLTAAILVASFGAGYFLTEQQFFLARAGNSIVGGYIQAAWVSLSVFTGFNLTEIDDRIRSRLYNWFLLEALAGLIFIGFLAASLHRRISMRRD